MNLSSEINSKTIDGEHEQAAYIFNTGLEVGLKKKKKKKKKKQEEEE